MQTRTMLSRFRHHGQRGQRGYSFIELLAVTAIVLILASAIMPLVKVTMRRQKEIELRRSLREMRLAIDRFKDAADLQMIAMQDLEAGNEGYPESLEILVEGVTMSGDASGKKLKFLRRIPIDPMTGVERMGHALVSGQARLHQLGRAERVRRLHQERRHRARRHEIQGLVGQEVVRHMRLRQLLREFRSGPAGVA